MSSEDISSSGDPVKGEAKKLRVIQELMETEKSYVESLRMLSDKFITPLTTSFEKQLSSDVVMTFKHIAMIRALNEGFLADLTTQVLGPEGSISRFPTLVANFAPTLRLYTMFTRSLPDCRRELGKLRAMPLFSRLLVAQETKCKSSLNSLLIQPVQRICRYPLLVKELLKHTPSSTDEHALLTKAYDAFSATAAYVDESDRKFRQTQRLVELQQALNHTGLVQRGRQLILEQPLLVGVPDGLRRPGFVLLCSDAIIITLIREKDGDAAKLCVDACESEYWREMALKGMEIAVRSNEKQKKLTLSPEKGDALMLVIDKGNGYRELRNELKKWIKEADGKGTAAEGSPRRGDSLRLNIGAVNRERRNSDTYAMQQCLSARRQAEAEAAASSASNHGSPRIDEKQHSKLTRTNSSKSFEAT